MGESGGSVAGPSSRRAKAMLVAVACLAVSCVVLGIVAIAASVRASGLGRDLAQTRTTLTDLTGRAASLEARLGRMEDARPEPPAGPGAEPHDARPAGGRERADPPGRPDLDALTASIRAAAEGFREGPAVRERESLPDKAGKFMERSLEDMAEGIDLWRRYRRGEIEEKEFERQRRKLRDSARGAIGSFFAVVWTDRSKGAPREREPAEKGPGEVF